MKNARLESFDFLGYTLGLRLFSHKIYGDPGVLVLNRVRKVWPTCAVQ